jgi:hypothetical protein
VTQIERITVHDNYRLEAHLDNGSTITLNLKTRLKTLRFAFLADPEFFARATTDGRFIRWGDKVEISLTELFQLAQK